MNQAIPSPASYAAHQSAAWLRLVVDNKAMPVVSFRLKPRSNQWDGDTGGLWLRCDVSDHVTIQRLEAALDLISECMVMHNRPQFGPYVERLEREIAALRSTDDVMERARRRLAKRRDQAA
ncbi:hypothetical protein QY049_03900 [Bradyrhizobium sp. WYCCWR 13022]|uniref:hypothetical protein n=1 Tax=unclassified Bradyrhizobium TaxID=2631580 RepID=UPI00263B1E49|nr:hypothetical protein [Bradyrhizobium sp. WYCCWR 13022]MDN4982366.1 hypothetical protein [Bradyrhizobium sp. WYCCWR 13022]